jgi:Na+/H+-dicarboxylate symporter
MIIVIEEVHVIIYYETIKSLLNFCIVVLFSCCVHFFVFLPRISQADEAEINLLQTLRKKSYWKLKVRRGDKSKTGRLKSD